MLLIYTGKNRVEYIEAELVLKFELKLKLIHINISVSI